MLEKLMVLFLIVLLSPILVFLSLLILIKDGWPFLFMEKRVGRKGKPFLIYKFRTMVVGAEKEQNKLQSQNEADGPVFKIHNDPRLTELGKFLRHTGIDEFPQLFNVLRGEMSLIGPRPLPVKERNKIEKKYLEREKVLPGILSPWIFDGYHNLSFKEWMESDLRYIKNKSWLTDTKLLFKGLKTFAKMVKVEIVDILTRF